MEIKKMPQNYNIFQRSYLFLQNVHLYLKAYADCGLKTDFCTFIVVLCMLSTTLFWEWGSLPNIYLSWCSDTSVKSDLEQVTF